MGNRSAALPLGLRVGFTAGMLGRSRTGSGEGIAAGNGGGAAGAAGACGAVVELGGAVIETATDAVGSFAR